MGVRKSHSLRLGSGERLEPRGKSPGSREGRGLATLGPRAAEPSSLALRAARIPEGQAKLERRNSLARGPRGE